MVHSAWFGWFPVLFSAQSTPATSSARRPSRTCSTQQSSSMPNPSDWGPTPCFTARSCPSLPTLSCLIHRLTEPMARVEPPRTKANDVVGTMNPYSFLTTVSLSRVGSAEQFGYVGQDHSRDRVRTVSPPRRGPRTSLIVIVIVFAVYIKSGVHLVHYPVNFICTVFENLYIVSTYLHLTYHAQKFNGVLQNTVRR